MNNQLLPEIMISSYYACRLQSRVPAVSFFQMKVARQCKIGTTCYCGAYVRTWGLTSTKFIYEVK